METEKFFTTTRGLKIGVFALFFGFSTVSLIQADVCTGGTGVQLIGQLPDSSVPLTIQFVRESLEREERQELRYPYYGNVFISWDELIQCGYKDLSITVTGTDLKSKKRYGGGRVCRIEHQKIGDPFTECQITVCELSPLSDECAKP